MTERGKQLRAKNTARQIELTAKRFMREWNIAKLNEMVELGLVTREELSGWFGSVRMPRVGRRLQAGAR